MPFQVAWNYPNSRGIRTFVTTLFVLDVVLALAVSLPTRQLPSSFEAPALVRWFFGHPWWATGVLVFVLVYGVMFCLAGAWHGVFRSSQWRAFNVADGITIPLLFAVIGMGFEMWGGSSRFYASAWWCWTCIGAGLFFSALNAANDARNAKGWRNAFNSPYAIYHALMLAGFIALGLIGASILVAASWRLTAAAAALFLAYIISPVLDAQNKAKGTRPLPGRGWGW